MANLISVQKLSITIGLFKNIKCECKKSHTELCDRKMPIPIIEIDGVKNLDCNIEFYQNGKGLCFRAETEFQYDGDELENPTIYFKAKYNKDGITKDDILEFSQNLLDELPKLQLGLYGVLMVIDKEYISIQSALEDIFTTIESETFKVSKTGTCSVCYEKTYTKTPCGHLLCNRCWSKIEKNGGTDHDEIPCPLCRKNIYYI